MLPNQIELEQAQSRREEEIAEIARSRLLERPSPSARRALGMLIVKIRTRLAADPEPKLARTQS